LNYCILKENAKTGLQEEVNITLDRVSKVKSGLSHI